MAVTLYSLIDIIMDYQAVRSIVFNLLKELFKKIILSFIFSELLSKKHIFYNLACDSDKRLDRH